MSEAKVVISGQNDFGYTPLLLAKFVTRPELCGVFGFIYTMLTWSVLGPVGGIVAAIAATSDTVVASGTRKKVAPPKDLLAFENGAWGFVKQKAIAPQAVPADPSAIEVPAETVVDSTSTVSAGTPRTDPAEQVTETIRERPQADTGTARYKNIPFGGNQSQPNEAHSRPQSLDEIASNFGHTEPTQAEKDELIRARKKTVESSAQGIVSELFEREDDCFRSWFIMGVTGAGKGVFLAYALIMAKAHMPGVSIWAIDPKSDPQEYYRWAFLDENKRYHYDAMKPTFGREDKIKIKAGIQRVLDGYAADPSEYKLLIIDELPAILSSLGTAARDALKYFNRIASMGRSRNNVVWLLSNAIGLQQNGITKGDRDYYQTLYLATPSKLAPITGYKEFDGPCIGRSDAIFSETGRAAWASTKDRWEPVPTTYHKAVKELPPVSPPADLGTGSFTDWQAEIEFVCIAEALREELLDTGLNKASLLSLLEQTEYSELAGKPNADTTIGEKLRSYPDIISIRKSAKGYMASVPSTAAPKQDNIFELDFL